MKCCTIHLLQETRQWCAASERHVNSNSGPELSSSLHDCWSQPIGMSGGETVAKQSVWRPRRAVDLLGRRLHLSCCRGITVENGAPAGSNIM
jgi:hypothetical protein